MAQVFVNNAFGVLASGITAFSTSLTLDTGTGSRFPAPVAPDYAILTLTQAGDESSWEEVKLTGRSGDVLTVERGHEGSTAASWVDGSKVELRITAEALNNTGRRGIPSVEKSANYTCVLSDRGGSVRHPSSDTTARTFTIPANASVPYAVDDVLTFINCNGAGVLTIAIDTDTLRMAGSGDTGSRSLAENGIATAIKVAATEWMISGVGLS